MPVIRHAVAGDPRHLLAAFKLLGLHEVPGPRHNPTVVKFFAEVGLPGIKDDETAWCAVFVGSQLKAGGLPWLPSAAARSYLEWGKATEKPKRGDVCIIKRGTGWQGHVFFFLGIENGRVVGLGGNQRDQVSVADFPLQAVLGFRTAVTPRNSRTVKASVVTGAGGAVTMGAGQVAVQANNMLAAAPPGVAELHTDMAQKVSDAGGVLEGLASISPWLFFCGGMLMVGGIGWGLYARWLDWQEKAR